MCCGLVSHLKGCIVGFYPSHLTAPQDVLAIKDGNLFTRVEIGRHGACYHLGLAGRRHLVADVALLLSHGTRG